MKGLTTAAQQSIYTIFEPFYLQDRKAGQRSICEKSTKKLDGMNKRNGDGLTKRNQGGVAT